MDCFFGVFSNTGFGCRSNNSRARPKTSAEFFSHENEDGLVLTDDSFGRQDDGEELRAAANQKISILRQDNFQYKQTNSLLKRKLQEMISSWEAEKKVHLSSPPPEQRFLTALSGVPNMKQKTFCTNSWSSLFLQKMQTEAVK